MENPDTRKSLLIRLNESSHDDAWPEFVEIYEPLIYRLAKAKGLQHADAEDMTQGFFAHSAILPPDLDRLVSLPLRL